MTASARLTHFVLRFLPLFLVLLDQAVISGTRLVLQIAVGRNAPEQLGLFGVAMGVVLVMVSFQEALVTTPYTVFATRQLPEESRRFAAGGLWTQLLLMLVVVSVWGCVIAYRGAGSREEAPMLAVFATLLWFAPSQMLREFARRHLLTQGPRTGLLGLDLFASAIVLLWPGILLWSGAVTARQVFFVIAIANLGHVLVWWLWYHRQFPLWQTTPRRFLGLSWSYGRWIVGENLLNALVMGWMGWHLAWSGGPGIGERNAGLLQSCLTVVLLANPFLLGFASFLGPRAAEVYHREGRPALMKLIWGSTLFVTLVLAGLAAFLWPWGEWLLTLMFGQSYAGYGHLVGIFSIGMIGTGISFVATAGLQTAGRPQVNFYGSIASLLFIVVWAWVRVGNDLEEAAIGFVLAVLVGMAVRLLGLVFSGPVGAGNGRPENSVASTVGQAG